MDKIKKIIPVKYHKYFIKMKNMFFNDIYATKFYSQEGEDMILRRIFEKQKTGFYVDIGAHHPNVFLTHTIFIKKDGGA